MSPLPHPARLQVLLDTLFILYLTKSLEQLCLPLSYSCRAFRPVGSILWPADDKEDQVTANWLSRRGGWKETVKHRGWAGESCKKKIINIFFFVFELLEPIRGNEGVAGCCRLDGKWLLWKTTLHLASSRKSRVV